MKDVKKWIVALSMGLAAAGPLAAHAQDCDAAALTCFASQPAARAGGASFLDLVREGNAAALEPVRERDPLPQPAVYVTAEARAPTAADMAPAGLGALDSAMGTQLSSSAAPAWLALPKSLATPDSSVAWIFAAGFLGFVILRRVRAAPTY